MVRAEFEEAIEDICTIVALEKIERIQMQSLRTGK